MCLPFCLSQFLLVISAGNIAVLVAGPVSQTARLFLVVDSPSCCRLLCLTSSPRAPVFIVGTTVDDLTRILLGSNGSCTAFWPREFCYTFAKRWRTTDSRGMHGPWFLRRKAVGVWVTRQAIAGPSTQSQASILQLHYDIPFQETSGPPAIQPSALGLVTSCWRFYCGRLTTCLSRYSPISIFCIMILP